MSSEEKTAKTNNNIHHNFLDFEQPLAELEAKIEALRLLDNDTGININDELQTLTAKSRELTESIFANLTAKQITQLARHPLRPYSLDYIDRIFTDFDELHGDRHYADDHAVVGGMARLDDKPVMVIGQQKGRNTKERQKRNFGMSNPEGFRKALRLFKLAEKFHLPVITFIDTPGAYPGIGAEERNQSEAIAENLKVLSSLKVPVICCIIGEGCSGGALGICVGDRTLMLQYSYFSVISPEGCASILWKSAEKAAEAADAMCITADKLIKHGFIDQLIKEPLGGAHRDHDAIAATLKTAITKELAVLQAQPIQKVVEQRYDRLLKIGA